ncbi:Ribosomal_protein S9 [Hexamita inflata]|uniref:Ribosomal protein S9 n=1 Tax=Hexamita inflata TaxID=28002 RepID=A0AA86P0Z2_9EUKA|nr:Ribosomal protein S9 [Hexamita inflata]CAI9929010.1 Ribosomal protein S9 [Hexamita inflata]
MPSVTRHRNSTKMYNTPRRPFVGARIKSELELVGKYGLRCKREIYRAKFMLRKIRSTARDLLTLESSDPKLKFEGDALLRRLHLLGVLDTDKNELDYVLSLKVEDLLKRRIQSVITDNNTTKSIHQARVWIKQGHIQVGSQIVNVPSFLVRTASEKYIKIAERSPFGANAKPGRCARKNANKK